MPMTPLAQPVVPAPQPLLARSPTRDMSIDYLRGAATVLVVLAHCVVPYLVRQPWFGADAWLVPIPIQDWNARSPLCDGIFALIDTSVISLWFFLSGLFSYKALRRKGAVQFLRDRLWRLGGPLAMMCLVLMPLAYYAPYGLLHPAGSLPQFWWIAARSGFPPGPGWFLWVLILLDVAVAGLFVLGGGVVERWRPRLEALKRSPIQAGAVLLLASLVLFLPLFLRYQDMWLRVPGLPFSAQRARLLVYAMWLLVGVLVGSVDLEAGLLARTGALVRNWPAWLAASLIVGALRCSVAVSPELQRLGPADGAVFRGTVWILTDTCLCLALPAFFRAVIRRRYRWADSFTRYAYAIYACHYIFALWVERFLLPAAIPALAKSAISFVFTLSLSWLAAALWYRLPAFPARRSASPSMVAREAP